MAPNYTPAPKMSMNRNMSLPGVPDPMRGVQQPAYAAPKKAYAPVFNPAPAPRDPLGQGFYGAGTSFAGQETMADPALAGQNLLGGFVVPPPAPMTSSESGASDPINGPTLPQPGLTQPIMGSPDYSAIDSRIASLMGQNPEDEIRQRLQREADIIDEQYTQETLNAQRASKNRTGEQFGDLANLMVNPSSSGAANVANTENASYQSILQNLALNRALQKRNAESNIRGEVNTSYANQLKAAKDERASLEARAQQDYENTRQKLQDDISIINNSINVAKENRAASNLERDDARASIDSMFKFLGSEAFADVADLELRSLEKTAGLPAGTIKKGMQTLKQQEMQAKIQKPELREVGGSLYSISYDEYGKPVVNPLVKKATSGSGGGVNPQDPTAVQAANEFAAAVGRYPTKAELDYVVGQYKSNPNNPFAGIAAAYKNVQKYSPGTFDFGFDTPDTVPTQTSNSTPKTISNSYLDTILDEEFGK